MLGSTTGCWANGCSGFGMLVQAGRRWKAKNSPLCRARQPASWAPSGFLRRTNQPTASPLVEWNVGMMRSNRAREEGIERRREAALHSVSSGACHSMCQQLGGFFPVKKGGYPDPGPWQLCVSNKEPSVQPLHCFSVFVPCPAQQSLPWAKDLWEFWEGTGWITRLCHCPRATLDTARVEQDTGMKDLFPFARSGVT